VKRARTEKFKVKKPIKIQYASKKEVAEAAGEVRREHKELIWLLSKT
jgi:hypothetical protein